MYMRKANILLVGLCCLLPEMAWAQEEKKAHGTALLPVELDADITVRDAKLRCIELAKADAIKNVFGELVTADIIDVTSSNKENRSDYMDISIAKAKGNWLGDTKDPEVSVTYYKDRLLFKAEVWGVVREITQAQTDLKWGVITASGREADEFRYGDNFFVKFRSPSDGYVAVYLVSDDGEAQCLLPYKHNPKGQHFIKGGTDYVFFDKEKDSEADPYKLKPTRDMERFRFVIVYSPNAFTKCNDTTGDKKHPNSLSSKDFQKWLLKCQREDERMEVKEKLVRARK